MPMDKLVAVIFPKASRIINHSAYWPAAALSITG